MVCWQHVPNSTLSYMQYYLYTTHLQKLHVNYTQLLQVIQDYRGQDLNTIITQVLQVRGGWLRQIGAETSLPFTFGLGQYAKTFVILYHCKDPL